MPLMKKRLVGANKANYVLRTQLGQTMTLGERKIHIKNLA